MRVVEGTSDIMLGGRRKALDGVRVAHRSIAGVVRSRAQSCAGAEIIYPPFDVEFLEDEVRKQARD
jgi:hypothetical protein